MQYAFHAGSWVSLCAAALFHLIEFSPEVTGHLFLVLQMEETLYWMLGLTQIRLLSCLVVFTKY